MKYIITAKRGKIPPPAHIEEIVRNIKGCKLIKFSARNWINFVFTVEIEDNIVLKEFKKLKTYFKSFTFVKVTKVLMDLVIKYQKSKWVKTLYDQKISETAYNQLIKQAKNNFVINALAADPCVVAALKEE